MDSTAADSKRGSRLAQRAGRAATAVVVLLYSLQVTLVVAFLLGLAGSSPGISVVVEGSARVPSGSSFVLTASVWAGPGEPWRRPVELGAAIGTEAAVPCRQAGSVWHCELRAPGVEGMLDARVEAWPAGSATPAVFPVRLEVVRPSAAVGSRGLQGDASPRGRSLAGRDQEPAVNVAGAPECPWLLAVAPEGGIAVAAVLQGYWLHLVDAQGSPRSNVAIECTVADEPLPMRAVTDALGTAQIERIVPWEERWLCSFLCDGREAVREVSVNPSWDGIVVAPTRPTGAAGGPAVLVASHQRSFGGWYLSLVCDDAPVAASAYVVESGRAAFEWGIPPAPGELRLCALQASTSPRGTPSARAAHWWLVRAGTVGEALAVEQLGAIIEASGPAWLRPHAAGLVRAGLARASESAVSRYGRFLLSGLPQPWSATSILTDGIALRGAQWEAERLRLGRVAAGLLAVDVLLLVLAVALVLLPAAMRRRRALLRVTDEEADEDSERLARTSLLGGLAAVVLAIGVVASFAVAMSTLLTAIW